MEKNPYCPATSKWVQNSSFNEENPLNRKKIQGTKCKRLLCPILPGLVDGHQFLHGVALDERSGVLGVVGDDLMDSVEDRDHRVALQVPGRVLLATRQVAH